MMKGGMMPPGACFKGKDKGKGKAWQPPQEQGIPGLNNALHEALTGLATQGEDISELVKKIIGKVNKICEKYSKDERATTKATVTQAKALIEEFVEHVMGNIHGICWGKEWFPTISWTQPLLMMVLYTFQNGKVFHRTLKPKLITFIDGGIFKWQEEERVQAAMAQAILVCGINESHQKKAAKCLTKAYDDAHFKAPYGSTSNDSPELAVLQDFVKGWMAEFVGGCQWDVLENGLADTSEDIQIATISTLFQNLMDPNIACMPYEIATEITNVLGGLPASPWPYVDQAAQQVFAEHKAANPPKRQKIN